LEKAGHEHQGLCPFHNEKTPSFTVNDDKGFFHCFGCGAHGDVLDFEMRAGGLSFLDAVEQLAGEAGLPMPEESPEERQREARRATLHQANEAACAFFEAQLQRPGGAEGLAYLVGRGLSDETIARFRLGWAPSGGDVLRRTLIADGFAPDLLEEAGLVRTGEDGAARDMFRGRVTFPIGDRRGRVIGFGARALGDAKPKYLNTPATPLFDKGATLYGLAQARETAAKEGAVVVVEGYMDVVSTHQAGMPVTVAPLGTALTERHLAELWRLAPEPVLCLDGDAAGQRAMASAAERALSVLAAGCSLRFAVLPEGEDPDSLARAGELSTLKARIGAARPLADVVWQLAEARFPPDTPERLAAFESDLFFRAASVPAEGARRHLLGEFRRRLRWGYEPPAPMILLGRSTKKLAPPPGHDWLRQEWAWARSAAEAGPVRDWLEKHGVDWGRMVAAVGGVGLVRAKVVKGKIGPAEGWAAESPPPLWQPEEVGASLLVLPEWEGGPGEGALLDLVGWNVRTGDLACRTGHAVILGAAVVAEARGFEGQGLSRPVRVAETPLSWLREMAPAGDGGPEGRGAATGPVLVVDWKRAWGALGGLSTLVAETIELGEALEKHVQPPPLPTPRIRVSVGEPG
jgi:DNA primase